jgi:hypothetical protein
MPGLCIRNLHQKRQIHQGRRGDADILRRQCHLNSTAYAFRIGFTPLPPLLKASGVASVRCSLRAGPLHQVKITEILAPQSVVVKPKNGSRIVDRNAVLLIPIGKPDLKDRQRGPSSAGWHLKL